MRTKLAKIGVYGFTGLVFLLAGVYTVLLSPPVQLWITQKFTAQLSKQLHTNVTLSGVDFRPINTLILEDLTIEGYANDTMIYVEYIKVNINDLNTEAQKIKLDQLVLSGTEVTLVKQEGDTEFNYERALGYINQPSTDTTEEFKPWTIESGSLVLEGAKFTYRDKNKPPPTDRDFDENYMVYDNIIGNFSNFSLINDSLNFKSKHLQCTERSGLNVQHLKGDIVISRTVMNFTNLSLKTDNSSIGDEIKFSYNSYRDLSDFLSKVNIESTLKDASVDFDDLKLFSHNLDSYDEKVFINGNVRGTIRNIKGKNINAAFGKNSSFSGTISLNGLPNIEETFIDIKFDKSYTNEGDIKRLIKEISLPDNFKLLGNISFDGYFTGFYKDFVAYGVFNTAIGNIKSDINLKLQGENNNASYSGNFAANNFNIGKFYQLSPTVSNVTFNAKINGEGINVDNFDVNMEGAVKSLIVNGYDYKNIAIKGQLTKDLFTGQASTNEENGRLDFDGTVNIGGDKPIMNFTADMAGVNLKALNIEPNTSALNVMLLANFEGSSIDDLNGKVSFNDLSFKHKSKKYKYQQGVLSASVKNGKRSLVLQSDMADARIDGEYNIENLAESVQELVASYIPYIIKPQGITMPKENFTFTAQLKKPKEFSELFLNGIELGRISAQGFYNSDIGSLRLDASATKIMSKSYLANNVSVLFEKVGDSTLQARVLTDNFYDGDSIIAADINILSKIIPNYINFDIKIRDTSQTVAAYMKGDFRFESDSVVSTIFSKAELYLERQKWDITTEKPIYIEPGKFTFNKFAMFHNNQSLKIDGIASANDDSLSIDVTNFNIYDIRRLIDYSGPEMAGIANGNLMVQRVLATPYIVANLKVADFSFDKDTFGDFTVFSATTNVPEQLKINVRAENGQLKNFNVSGHINYASTSQNMDLHVTLPVTKASVLDHFLEGEVNFTDGYIASNLDVMGKFDNPQISGKVHFINSKFRYNFTNVEYSFNQTVELNNRKIDLGEFDLIDDKGKAAKVKGEIKHKNYDNFDFNIFVSDIKDYHVLNTAYPNNPGFYGNAYADGNMRITGPLEDVTIDIYAKSKPGSWVSISVEDDETVGQSGYITFVDNSEKAIEKDYEEVPLITGVNLNINLELTDDMKGGIVFDRAAGDSIAGLGSGNLSLKINTYGDFSMYGNYVIDQGDYAFTALDFIKRKFKIQKGSKIAWSGDPYEALLDITAVYTTNAQLGILAAGVVNSRDVEQFNVNVPVDAQLIIRGSLSEPEITFDIDFDKLEKEIGQQTSTSDLSAIFRRIENNPDELNRQVFSLLVLNSFAPPTFASSTVGSGLGANAVSNNVSQFISNQLTNVLSQYSKDFEVGLDYYSGSADKNQEIILSLKKTFLNDRLSVQLDGGRQESSTSTQYNVNVEYSITPDGKVKARVYNSSSNHPIFNTNVNNFGMGFYIRSEFEHFKDLFKKRNSEATKDDDPTVDP